jgi:adenine C2-methylase RlmN of 23S rRNA A2503 and tRNA A37
MINLIYLEAFNENLYKCYDKVKIDDFIKNKKNYSIPIQYIRGKNCDDILVVETQSTKPQKC